MSLPQAGQLIIAAEYITGELQSTAEQSDHSRKTELWEAMTSFWAGVSNSETDPRPNSARKELQGFPLAVVALTFISSEESVFIELLDYGPLYRGAGHLDG
jgi:hypothetical protein